MSSFLNIYPWFFFYLLFLGQGAQSYQIYKTKKTEGLSATTFLIALLSSTCFGWTSFLGGKESYPLVISNGISILVLSYIIFYIWKNDNFKWKYLWSFIIFTSGLVLLILGTINYINLENNISPLFKINNIPNWILLVIPTIGGIASAFIFVPQLLKIIKTKETKNLNYFLMIFFMFYLVNIMIFWFIYGIDEHTWSLSIPTIVFSGAATIVQGVIIFIKYKDEKTAVFNHQQ